MPINSHQATDPARRAFNDLWYTIVWAPITWEYEIQPPVVGRQAKAMPSVERGGSECSYSGLRHTCPAKTPK